MLSLALVITPHLERFPLWCSFLIAGLFLWRLIGINKPGWMPSKWLLLIIIILSGIGLFMHFGTLFGKTAGSALLALLLVIKLHESKTRRDYMLLISLSFFIIVTNFLFSQSIPTVALMLISIIVLLMSMMTISHYDPSNQSASIQTSLTHKDKLKLASRMLLLALPLMAVMFVLFPRISGPLWKLPEEEKTAITGLSDTMSPGNISSLIQSSAVAFRVKFDDQIPEQQDLYWRALVLWHFDGRTWEQGRKNQTPSPQLISVTDPVSYSITLEPHQKNWLYALDMPVKVPDDINYTNNFVLRANKKISSLYQYSVSSSLTYVIQQTLSPWESSAGLKIVPQENLRTLQLGQQIAQQYSNNEAIVNHVLQMFNAENFHYTLKPPLTPGSDPVDQFLFKTRRGFCEHYTSSFTLLMRAAGIPSRVVVGYQGGTLNPVNQTLTVRQSDAHAWSEVWLEQRGWVRIDPTASIAPQRIERNLNAALADNETRPLHIQISSSAFRDLVFYWDAIDNQWNQWIIGYDTKLQQALLSQIFNQPMKFSEMILYMAGGFIVVLAIISILIIRPFKKQTTDPVVKLYQQFCRKLEKHGLYKEAYEGPDDFAQRAIIALPNARHSIELITRLYIKLRYQAAQSAQQLERQQKQLQQQVKAFKPTV